MIINYFIQVICIINWFIQVDLGLIDWTSILLLKKPFLFIYSYISFELYNKIENKSYNINSNIFKQKENINWLNIIVNEYDSWNPVHNYKCMNMKINANIDRIQSIDCVDNLDISSMCQKSI